MTTELFTALFSALLVLYLVLIVAFLIYKHSSEEKYNKWSMQLPIRTGQFKIKKNQLFFKDKLYGSFENTDIKYLKIYNNSIITIELSDLKSIPKFKYKSVNYTQVWYKLNNF